MLARGGRLTLFVVKRISASSYSNTAPLLWSFLYGSEHGKVEVILDNAPSRSAQLLSEDRVDAALVPVIGFQMIDDVRLIPEVCVGAKHQVQSVCLVTKGEDLSDVKSVALDTSSMTSAVLTKIIFREFLNHEPEWRDAEPDINAMLLAADCALIIGDPALNIKSQRSEISNLRSFDLAGLWHENTGLGFVFAMWMTRRETCDIDFAAARDEGLEHLEEIITNYQAAIDIDRDWFRRYLTENISYTIDDRMRRGLELFFDLAAKHRLIEQNRPMTFDRAPR